MVSGGADGPGRGSPCRAKSGCAGRECGKGSGGAGASGLSEGS